jgi:predicted RNA-binding Zn-ribbon protein involved in translation (DUF1610 family)
MSYGTKEQPTKACEGCGEPLPLLRHYKTYLCDDCKENHTRRIGSNAHRLVAAAIRYGFISPISECRCVDCGDKATDYDHRDYNKPLEVDPVCRPCNFKRGPAKPFLGTKEAKMTL